MHLPPSPFARAAVLACCALSAAACDRHPVEGRAPDAGPPTVAAEPPRLTASIVRVAPWICMLGGTEPSACYVIEGSDGLALVDTGQDADARSVRQQMRAAGFDPQRIRWIFLTHAHGDHTLGARQLRAETGAKVYAGRGDCGVLRAGGPREAFFSVFEDAPEAHATPVDVELAGGEVVDLGGVRVRAIATPGHTPGSVCYLAERDGRRALFTGDVVASLTNGDPALGAGSYSAFLPPRFRGDAETSLASLRALAAMDVPDLVLPGHPRLDPSARSPHLTQAAWDSLLAEGIVRLETLVARRRRDGEGFLDGTPKELLRGVHYWGEGRGGAVYGLVTGADALYVFNVPDADDPAAFLRQRCAESGLGAKVPAAVILTTGGPPATDGLRRLVEATGCAVVAPRAAFDHVRGICPALRELVAAEDLAERGWFPVQVLDVEGPRTPSASYVLTVRGKTVVVSGRYPVPITAGADVDDLRKRLPAPHAVEAYIGSLERFAHVRPDVWLPLFPGPARDSNVYDDAWTRVIASNRAALR